MRPGPAGEQAWPARAFQDRLYTAIEVTSGVGIAVSGTVLAALFTGDIATSNRSTQQTAQFQEAVTIAGLVLTVAAAALVGRGILRTRSAGVLP
ncbi:hypothetical protein [Streptomyces sp. NBC_01800]|uniref:hypothetical protein n=1 Tax=Streptomyces sp. NBC_01800 TaxID=2975945 RepID=UPI002DD9A335|nr:hypothetical protein [Streptomyces sp. NBC_01800]WSA65736.1 hypothetical protein OIE65_01085 [Streptomyces sp. NBC_01800]WSA73381.1 hypothetical protein OIE65_44975 [Streptomyces sp. NBC_01800]